MRSVLVAGGVAIAGTALGTLAYTVVSAPADGTDATSATTTDCGPRERKVGPDCVQVVHVLRGGTGPTSSARSDDVQDDQGDSRDDDGAGRDDDGRDHAEDDAEDAAQDAAEDAADDHDDADDDSDDDSDDD